MSGPELITLGCRLNIAESDAMRALARDQDDLVIVNSCAVTAEAVRQTRKAIRRARLARPDARILVTGCAAEIEPERFARMPEVTGVVRTPGKYSIESFIKPSPRRGEGLGEGPSRFPPTVKPSLPFAPSPRPSPRGGEGEVAFADHTRAFVEVQNGCDHRCTFCIIPYGRGASRSLPAGVVVDRIKRLVDEGFREVVLTGVDVTSYGPDLPGSPTLGMLVERILRHVPELPRLRLSSLDSVEIDDRLFDIVTGEPRMMPHLHLSLQSGDDMILKRMKRRHNRAQAIEMVSRLRAARPEIAIGADIIAGFPTETDTMFENSLRLIDDCDIVFGHIFPYSPREGTPAARMPQVDPAVAKDRARQLREAASARQQAWLRSLVGTVQNVLVERDGKAGHAENFATVRLSSPSLDAGELVGRIVPSRITALSGPTLTGAPA